MTERYTSIGDDPVIQLLKRITQDAVQICSNTPTHTSLYTKGDERVTDVYSPLLNDPEGYARRYTFKNSNGEEL